MSGSRYAAEAGENGTTTTATATTTATTTPAAAAVPLPLRILLAASCLAPPQRTGSGDEPRRHHCRGCSCGPRARAALVALRVLLGVYNSLDPVTLHGQFPFLKSYFSLVGFVVYCFCIPHTTYHMHQFFERDGGTVDARDAARLASHFSTSTLWCSTTLPSWILVVVLTFFALLAVFLPWTGSSMGKDTWWGRHDLVAVEIEARTGMEVTWTSLDTFTVPGLNSSQLATLVEDVDKDLVVPPGLWTWWLCDEVASRMFLVIAMWPFFAAMPVFIWHGLLQTMRQREATAACVAMVMAATAKTSGTDAAATAARLQLLEQLGEQVDAAAGPMRVLNMRLARCAANGALMGCAAMVGFIADQVAPVSEVRADNMPLWVHLPILLSCATLFFTVLGVATWPAMAWQAFLRAFRAPAMVGRLHWAPIGVLLDGWAAREREFSWVLLGVPVTATLYNQMLLGVGSGLSVVVAIMLRSS